MELKTIHTKTAKGVTQVNQKTASLSRDLMKALKLVDGKSTLAQLAEKADFPVPAMEKALIQLAKDGFIKVFETVKESAGFEDDFDFTAPGKLATPAPGRLASPAQAAPAPTKDESAALAAAREKAQAEARARMEREAQIRARLEVEARGKAEAEKRAMEEAKRAQEASERAKRELETKLAEEKVRQQALSDSHARLTQEQIKKGEEEAKAIAGLRAKAEAEAKALAAARIKAEAEAKALAAARAEAEIAAKRQAEEAVQAQKELRAKLKEEIEARIRTEIEQKLRVEIEEEARGELEAAVMAEAKEEARAELEKRLAEEAESLSRLEAEAKRRAEEQTRQMLAEQETRLRAEMEQRIKAETETLQQASVEARMRAEKEARERAELEARLKAEAGNRQRLEARAREDAEQRTRLETEMKVRLEAEQRGKLEAEARARREAEERERREAEASIKLDLERRARAEAEKKAETEAKAREIAMKAAEEQAEAKTKLAADAEGRLEEERKARIKAEAKSRAQEEAEERDRQEQVAHLKRLQEQAERVQQKRSTADDQEEPAARRRPGRKIPWVRYVITAVLVVIVAGIGLLHVIPLPSVTTKVQKGLAGWLHDDVSIGSVRLSLFPSPRLKLDGISVGKVFDAKASSGVMQVDLGTLFDENLMVDTLELENVSIGAEALKRVAQWNNPQDRPANVRIRHIVMHAVKLETTDIAIESLDADLTLNKEGTLARATLRTRDGKWTLDAKPEGDKWQVEFNAHGFPLPGAKIALDDVRAKGTLSGKEIVAPELEVSLFGGSGTGSLRVDWSNGINFTSDLAVKQIDLTRLFENFSRDITIIGRMEGAFSFSGNAPLLSGVLKAPRAQGTFTVKEGSVSNIDLVQAMRSPESGGRGGSTKFSELVGALQVGGGEIRYSKMKLAGGVLLASGDVAVLDNGTVTGNIGAEIRSSVAQDHGSFTLSGSVAKPQLRRGGR